MKNVMKISFLLSFLLSLTHWQLLAQTGAGFFENKGQWEGGFLYKSNIPSGNFFIDPTGYTLLQYNADDVNKMMGHYQSKFDKRIEPIKITPPGERGSTSSDSGFSIREHVYRVTFLGSTRQINSKGERPTGERANFFIGNDPTKWKTDVQSFYSVRVQNMYPGIDVKYYNYNEKIKFDILVEPGANPSLIKLKYEGADKIEVVKGELVITTSLGVVKEMKPYAYQIIEGTKKEIPCSYQLANNQVSYKLQGYIKNAPLVIDPELALSTYTGSTSPNWGYTAAPGPDKSIYSAGIVFNTPFTNYGTTTGAYQQFNNSRPGMVDIGITRIAYNGDDPNIVPNPPPSINGDIFSTYIGGEFNEFPHSLIVDGNGDVVILGRTDSNDDFPHTKIWGSLGGWDIFVFKLSRDGKIPKGSMLIGGNGDDGANYGGRFEDIGPLDIFKGEPYRLNYGDNSRSEVILDKNGDIFIASNSSSTNFLTKNAHVPSAIGKQDGVLLKLKSDLSDVLFSSFIGGSGFDAAICLGYDPISNRVFVGGYTESNDFKGTNSGLNPSRVGKLDGFISIYNNDGSHFRFSYLGTKEQDYIYAVQIDESGFPYVLGVSYGDWLIKSSGLTTKFFSVPKGKQFVSKLDPLLTNFIFSTRFGSGTGSVHDISPIAFLVDQCERIFIAGWVNTSFDAGFDCNANNNAKNMITINPLKGNTPSTQKYERGDGKDFYFLVFEKNLPDVLFASFWGQQGGSFDHVDGGTSRFDKQGRIYMASCSFCGGRDACSDYPNDYDLPMRNFPDRVEFHQTQNNAPCNMHSLIYDLGLGSAVAGITPFADGIAFKRNGCDNLLVRFVAKNTEDEVIELPADGSKVPSLPGVTYDWDFGPLGAKPNAGRDVEQNFPYDPSILAYTVTLTVTDPSKVCKPVATTTTTITVGNIKADLKAAYERPNCQKKEFIFKNNSKPPLGYSFGANSFVWNIEGVDLAPRDNSDFNYTFPAIGTYKVKLKLTDLNFCNNGEVIEFDVFVSDDVKPTLGPLGPVCLNPLTGKATVQFKAGGGPQVDWTFSDDPTTATGLNVAKVYTSPGLYDVTLVVTDFAACKKTETKTFKINVFSTPKSNFTFSPPQENTPVLFTNLTLPLDPAKQSYKWDFRDGDTSNQISPSHLFNFTTKYDVMLIAIDNASGCKDTSFKPIFTKVSPLVNIPNAFTPLGATNKTFGIVGFGIVRVDFQIYNRWGVKLFDTAEFGSLRREWDGTYKGVLQPMDVYTYVAEVFFSDGEKQTLRGDVTLIR